MRIILYIPFSVISGCGAGISMSHPCNTRSSLAGVRLKSEALPFIMSKTLASEWKFPQPSYKPVAKRNTMPVKEISGSKLVIRLPDRDILSEAAKKYLNERMLLHLADVSKSFGAAPMTPEA